MTELIGMLTVFSSLKNELLKINGPQDLNAILSILALLLTGLLFVINRVRPWMSARREAKALLARLGNKFFLTHEALAQTFRFYVEPDCQDIDPARAEEPRSVYCVRQSLFSALDDATLRDIEHRFVIILADSGMGKTSALLNYYAREIRKRRDRKFAFVSLNQPDADNQIQSALHTKDVDVLMLDALDEDPQAIADHRARIQKLVNMTCSIRHVLVTCRTQFFSKEEEIPRETGIVKVGARAAGDSREYCFHKIYLSPLSDSQVSLFLKKRYPWYQFSRRRKVRQIVDKIPNLAVRPMLLAHVDDIVDKPAMISTATALYGEMINAWLIREQGLSGPPEKLREFSIKLAVDLFVGREKRGAERVSKAELAQLASKWQIAIEDWKLSGRSLLNRDVDGNFKFAHRSILEYLFSVSAIQGNASCFQVVWTDQITIFFCEAFLTNVVDRHKFRNWLTENHSEPGVWERASSVVLAILRQRNLVTLVLQNDSLAGDLAATLLALFDDRLKAKIAVRASFRRGSSVTSVELGGTSEISIRGWNTLSRTESADDLVKTVDRISGVSLVPVARVRKLGTTLILYLTLRRRDGSEVTILVAGPTADRLLFSRLNALSVRWMPRAVKKPAYYVQNKT